MALSAGRQARSFAVFKIHFGVELGDRNVDPNFRHPKVILAGQGCRGPRLIGVRADQDDQTGRRGFKILLVAHGSTRSLDAGRIPIAHFARIAAADDCDPDRG
jgi:hypothetical protein